MTNQEKISFDGKDFFKKETDLKVSNPQFFNNFLIPVMSNYHCRTGRLKKEI